MVYYLVNGKGIKRFESIGHLIAWLEEHHTREFWNVVETEETLEETHLLG